MQFHKGRYPNSTEEKINNKERSQRPQRLKNLTQRHKTKTDFKQEERKATEVRDLQGTVKIA
jgi:hypothetical protein